MMLRKFAAAAAVVCASLSSFAALPEGYVQLRYIQSDGNAWINTKYNPNETTRIEADIDLEDAASADQYVFGADDRTKKSNAAIAFRTHKATTAQAEVPGTGYGDVTLPNFSSTEYRAYRMEYETGVLTVKDKLTGESFVYDKSASFISSYQFVDALYVFSRRGSSSSLTDPGTVSAFSRVRSFRIYDGGALVRDFVPALRLSDGAMGFYDVSDHSSDAGYSPFYGNAAASGRLCSGPDADEMSGSRRLAYVEVTDAAGSQYVDTGYVFRQKPQVVARLMITGSAEADLMGTANKAVGCFLVSYNDGGRNVAYRYSTQDQVDFAYDESLLNVWTDFAWSNVVWHGAAKVGEVANWDFSSNAKTFRVFRGRDSKNACTSRIAAMKVYDGDELVFDFFPAMVDGVPGLYDSLTKTLYPSSGSKPLEAGPVVPTRKDDFSRLEVVGTPGAYGEVNPAYGRHAAHEGDTRVCTAPLSFESADVRGTLAGWELYEDGSFVRGEASASATVTIGSGESKLKWLWTVENRLNVGSTAGGKVTGGGDWYAPDAEVTLTAVPEEGCEFIKWLGDVPEDLRESNPLTLPVDRVKTITAHFRDPKVRYVDYVNGTDSGDGTVMPGWKTMKYAIDNAVAGDELVLAKGTHFCKDNLLIDKKLHIHGAGENWETVFDAEHKLVTNKGSNLKITADGVLVNNITFYRLCGHFYDLDSVVVSGDSVISNCVFTGCGFFETSGDNRRLIDMQKGELNSCWVTNNVYRYAPIVLLEGVNAVKCDNCVIAENRVVTQYSNNNDNGILAVRTGQTVVRNCTVANNCVYNNTSNPRQHGLSIRYASSLAPAPKIYNTIVWGNTNTAGVVRNVFSQGAAYMSNFIANDTTDTVDVNGTSYALNSSQVISKVTYLIGSENVTYDPVFDAWYGLVAGSPDAVKFGAKLDADADGVEYSTGSDIYGVPRGNKPSLGAYQYVESTVLAVKVVPSAETARLPETITLSAVVEGAASQTVTCAWDLDGDGEFDDGTGPSIVLDQVGEYPAVSVKVSDGVSTAANTYPGTLTVLEELLDVVIVANGKIVRQPSVLVFSAQIANAYVEPLSYSWDTDGDGVADWTGATVEYAGAGIYRAPTLLSIVDANGKHQENVTQEGTFNHHPEGAATYYVDYANGADGSAGSAANPWKTLVYAFDIADDGDEIVLKRGTHTVSSIVTLAKALRVRGEGAKEDTVIDANYGSAPEGNLSYWRFVISAAGASVSDLTFTRFGNGANDGRPGYICLYADSVISNVVVTSCGYNTVYTGHIVDMTAGLFTHSWVTNNIAGDCAGVQMTGPCVMENCAILGNSSVDGMHTAGAVVDLRQGAGDIIIRNCTIAGNTFAATNGAAIYGYLSDSKKGAAHLYDNIVWGNSCTKVGEIHPNAYNGASQQKWFVKNNCWDYDDDTRLKDPEGGTNFRNVNADPQFDLAHGGAPRLLLTSPCRNKGDNALGSTASVDILGNPRIKGGRIDIGCVEEPLGLGLGILVR